MVIKTDKRAEYMAALETASTNGDILPFAKFVVSILRQNDFCNLKFLWFTKVKYDKSSSSVRNLLLLRKTDLLDRTSC